MLKFIANHPLEVTLFSLFASVLTVLDFVYFHIISRAISFWRRRKQTQSQVETPEPSAIPPEQKAALSHSIPVKTPSGKSSEIAGHIQQNLVRHFNGYGDQARYEHFLSRVNAAPLGDWHKVAFINLKGTRKWEDIAEGLQEWTRIGFDTLAGKDAKWDNEATMNRLFGALHKELLREDYLKVKDGNQFADAWGSLVRKWRSDGL